MKQCFICQSPSEIIDEHHVWPQFAGGKQGPIVDLCSSCHSGIHRQALNLLAKRAERKQFFTGEALKRATPLIQYLMVALQKEKESKQKRQHKLDITIDSDLLVLLHMMKADAGFTNLNVFCRTVLMNYVKSRL